MLAARAWPKGAATPVLRPSHRGLAARPQPTALVTREGAEMNQAPFSPVRVEVIR